MDTKLKEKKTQTKYEYMRDLNLYTPCVSPDGNVVFYWYRYTLKTFLEEQTTLNGYLSKLTNEL